MADVVDLECSLTLSPRALEVSPMYDELHPSALHSQWVHPKDKISNDQKKDLVYHWECKADGCNSSYIDDFSGDLRRFFVDYVEVIDGGKRVMEILAVFQYGRCCGLGVFFDPLT